MFCPNCGKQLNESEKFCSECGAKTMVDAVNVQTIETKEPFSNNETTSSCENIAKSQRKKSKKKGLIILAVLALIFVLLFVVIGGDGDNENNPDTASSTTEIKDRNCMKLPTFLIGDAELKDWKEKSSSETNKGKFEVTDDFIIVYFNTKEEFDELKKASDKDTEYKINNLLAKECESIKEIKYDPDFKKATFVVKSNWGNTNDTIIIRKVGYLLVQSRAMFYEDYSGEIDIRIEDVDGKYVDEIIYKHPTERAIEITAQRLIDAYSANEVAANKLYKEKYLCITGVVDSIGEDMTDSLYITLSDGDEWNLDHVQCFFSDEYVNEISELTKGTTVTVYGTLNDYFMNILVEDCVLYVD